MLGSFIAPSSIRPLRHFAHPRQPPARVLQTAESAVTPQLVSDMSPTAPTSDYRLTCLCGAVEEPGTLLVSPTIPVPAREICWCTDCNYTTGGLGGAFPLLREAPSAASLSKCVKYDSSGTHRRYHCETCGCSTFVERTGVWFALGGIIERKQDALGSNDVKDTVRVDIHKWIKDTVDGALIPKMLTLGLSGKARNIELRETSLESRLMTAEEIKESESQSIERAKSRPSLDEKLTVKCHCGGVDLRIRRADFANDTQGMPERYLPPEKEKFIAKFCVCRSCRLSTGLSIQPWAYVPHVNITIAETGKEVKVGSNALVPEANKGTTLKVYNSSDDVYRSFCGTCGATVFYRAEKPGHHVVDVSVGLLRAEEGMMARRWLHWAWGSIANEKEIIDAELLHALTS